MTAPRSRRTRAHRDPEEEPRSGRGREPRKGRARRSNVGLTIGVIGGVVVLAIVGVLVLVVDGHKRRQDVLYPELRTLAPAIDSFKAAWNNNDAAAIGETIRPMKRKSVVKWLGTLGEKKGWADGRLTRLDEVDQHVGVKDPMTELIQVPVTFSCPTWGPNAHLVVRFEHMSKKWWVAKISPREN